MITDRLVGASFVAVVLLLSTGAAADDGEGRSLADALAAARDAGTPLLVVVHADWCAPCAELEEQVLLAPEVSARLEGLGTTLVDFDSDEGQGVVARHGVLSLPTALLLEPDGRERGRIEGFSGREAFLRRLELLRAGEDLPFDALLATATAAPTRAVEPWLACARFQLLRGDAAYGRSLAEWTVNRALASGDREGAGAAFELLGRYYVRVAWDLDEAVTVLAEGRARVAGCKKSVPRLLYWYALACLRQGDLDGAEMTLHGYAAAHPYDATPFLLRAQFFQEHGLDEECLLRDLGIVISIDTPPEVEAEARFVRARYELKRGDAGRALKALEKAVALAPERALYRRWRDRARRQLANPEVPEVR